MSSSSELEVYCLQTKPYKLDPFSQSMLVNSTTKSCQHLQHIRHEIVGIVTATGSGVKDLRAGDHVGVGTYVNSCRECVYCNEFCEIFCSKGATFTFNGMDSDGTVTKGGYSSYIVVHERQVMFHGLGLQVCGFSMNSGDLLGVIPQVLLQDT